jgi:hypothetical protein
MPVPKSRIQHASLVQEVAELLGISMDFVFLDVIKPNKNTIRVWTGDMKRNEKLRIMDLKKETKALAAKLHTKIAMSDKHPLGEDGQMAYEKRRRQGRSGARRDRAKKETEAENRAAADAEEAWGAAHDGVSTE